MQLALEGGDARQGGGSVEAVPDLRIRGFTQVLEGDGREEDRHNICLKLVDSREEGVFFESEGSEWLWETARQESKQARGAHGGGERQGEENIFI